MKYKIKVDFNKDSHYLWKARVNTNGIICWVKEYDNFDIFNLNISRYILIQGNKYPYHFLYKIEPIL